MSTSARGSCSASRAWPARRPDGTRTKALKSFPRFPRCGTKSGAQDADAVLEGIEQQIALDFYEGDVAGGQFGGVEIQVFDPVEGEAAAERRQAVEQPGAGLAPAREIGLAELEHQVCRKGAVTFEELDEVGEEAAVGDGMGRDVAEKIDVLVAAMYFAHQLDAAEQQHVVDRGDQPGAFGQPDILIRQDHGAALGAQPGEALIKAPLALRQADDRLQNQVDPVVA